MDAEPAIPTFEAIITPHRSLSPRGLATLLGAISAATLLIAGAVTAAGAWPAAGFGATEVLLAALLLRRSARDARACERLRLSESGLTIVRTNPRGGRSETLLPTAWLSVHLLDRPGRTSALVLSGNGRREEIARALGEAEKRHLATALANALHAHRHPRFDNPHLR